MYWRLRLRFPRCSVWMRIPGIDDPCTLGRVRHIPEWTGCLRPGGRECCSMDREGRAAFQVDLKDDWSMGSRCWRLPSGGRKNGEGLCVETSRSGGGERDRVVEYGELSLVMARPRQYLPKLARSDMILATRTRKNQINTGIVQRRSSVGWCKYQLKGLRKRHQNDELRAMTWAVGLFSPTKPLGVCGVWSGNGV